VGTPQAEELGRAVVAVQPRQIGALPSVYPILDALHLCSATNTLVPSQADVDPGRVVLLVVLSRLLSPRPLHQVQDWMSETVLPELLGISPEQAYDYRLGRALDRLHPCLGELRMQLVSQAIRTCALDPNVTSVLHFVGHSCRIQSDRVR
jgi:hypothetical protein